MGWAFPPYPENWRSIRQNILYRDGFCCRRCGTSVRPLQVDHIIPLSRGGTNNLSNLQTLCLRCHSLKHPHMVSYRRTKSNVAVHRLGLMGFYAIMVGGAIFFTGLFDMAFPTLKPSGSWRPGQPLPPLTYQTIVPEPLTAVLGLIILVAGIIALTLDPPRVYSGTEA